MLDEVLADTPLSDAPAVGEGDSDAAPTDAAVVPGDTGMAPVDVDAQVLGVVARAWAPGSGRGRHTTLPAWLVVGDGNARPRAGGGEPETHAMEAGGDVGIGGAAAAATKSGFTSGRAAPVSYVALV
ncbi:hypothetical protein N9L31_00115 [bacterium]|nr:hypothetical protein [bacterium]